MANEYLKDFKRLVLYEFTNPSASYAFEEGEEEQQPMGGDPSMGGDPNAMGGDPSMGGDPNAMGGDPGMGGDPSMGGDPGMGGDPNAMGGDPGMEGDPNAMGGDPSMGGSAQGPEGFSPQGVDQQQGLEGMGGEEQGTPGEEGGEDEEVIDVDDLTKSQEETEDKLDKLTSRFEKVFDSINDIERRISDIDSHTNHYLEKLGAEIEKRNPTPLQRMSMRTSKSAPYLMTPNEYMNNYAPDNYSPDDDNNGADDPQYKITKGDIDDFTDYSSVARDLNRGMGLHDILGY